MTRRTPDRPPSPPDGKPEAPPKPAESVRGEDPEAPGENEHQRISRRDHEKGRPKNTGREGA